MKSFLVKINTEEELIEGLTLLNNISALGKNINYGTYLPDSYNVIDIIENKINIWESDDISDDEICAFSISYDDDKYRNENFPDLYGNNHIQVSLTTRYDIRMGDIPKKTISYSNMVKETIKLMELDEIKQ